MTLRRLFKPVGVRRKNARLGVLLICILFLCACQPSPSKGTPAPAAPPTALPTPAETDTARIWASPAIPQALRDNFESHGVKFLAAEQSSANLYLDAAQTPAGAAHVSTWTYALVAPFPTLIDDLSLQELLAAWRGQNFGSFAGIPLLMDSPTRETFIRVWGSHAQGAVQVVPSDQILDAAWNQMPSWALVPFERIEPRWKVLTIDGQSPIQKKFDPLTYPLTVSYRLACSSPCQIPADVDFSFQNRDPDKLATVVMTGVTALVRATAKKMNVKGVLYPGEEVRGLLREADITHINNEVPFFTGCPPPDPKQTKLIFCSAPRYIELLTDVGTDVVELSGDHFADYGAAAMYETLEIYKKHQIPYYGGGYHLEDGRKPLLMEVNGNKIMFIGCNYKTIYASATDTAPGAVSCDFDYMTEQIKYYRSQGYLPISTFQYHEFNSPEARPQQKIDFRRMADAGAVIVSGSQAHVPQVMEFYNGAFIHYGLGNLFFDQISRRGPRLTEQEFIDRHVFYDGLYLGVELFTMRLIDYAKPRYMTSAEREKLLTMYFKASGWDFPQAGR